MGSLYHVLEYIELNLQFMIYFCVYGVKSEKNRLFDQIRTSAGG